VSGGTLATVLNLHEKYGFRGIADASKPWALSPVPGRESSTPKGLLNTRTEPELGLLTRSLTATTNRSIVHRSWGLIEGGKFYGPRFRYSEYMKVRNMFIAVLVNVALGTVILLLALAPVR
jgi:hypothetical protein